MARGKSSLLKRCEVLLPADLDAAMRAAAQASGEKVSEFIARSVAKRVKVKYGTQKPGRAKQEKAVD